MLKLLVRTLIILLAAALAAGGLYWFSGSAEGQSILYPAGGHDVQRFNQNAPAQSIQGGFDGGGDRDGGVNLARALPDILSKLGIIALITAVIVLSRKLLSLISRKRGPGITVPA